MGILRIRRESTRGVNIKDCEVLMPMEDKMYRKDWEMINILGMLLGICMIFIGLTMNVLANHIKKTKKSSEELEKRYKSNW